jgi:uncharacterized membrane protein SpoIIM required for sporulation
MVLERLYSMQWIEQKARYAFIMGLSYSILGIATAIFLFPDNPGLVAIAFTSLLILPSLQKLLALEESQAARENFFNIFKLFKDHSDIFKIYFFMFLGILLSFAFFSLVWPPLATSRIFAEQSSFILGGATGKAATGGILSMLIANNFKVLIVALLASLFYGTGAVFIITWNASVWGVIFGLIAKNSAAAAGTHPTIFFILMLIAVFPHMAFEAFAYFLGAISGGVLSKAVIREKLFSNRFNQIIKDSMMMFILAVIVVIIAALIEVYFTGHVISLFGLF